MKKSIDDLLRSMLVDIDIVYSVYSTQTKRRISGEGPFTTISEANKMESALRRIDSYINDIELELIEENKTIDVYKDCVGYDRFINIDSFRVVFWRESSMNFKHIVESRSSRQNRRE